MIPDRTLISRIAFATLKGITPTLAQEIKARIDSEEAFFEATERQLAAVMGFQSKLFDRAYRDRLVAEATREADFIAAGNIRPIYYEDDAYPTRLADCPDAPLMLYSTGRCDLNTSLTVGIVGTRHATPYGLEFTRTLVRELAEKTDGRVVIVSGLAFGIDIEAHNAAMREGLPTVAVLAHGLNTIYPAQHRNAAAKIALGGGMLLTDYRSCDNVHRSNFLARNRIVAGLSDCLVVAESATKGGALVTARIANDYGRDVFALPGRISDKYSAGCNSLIEHNMAALITDADHLIDSMGWPRRATQAVQASLFPDLTPEEEAVAQYLRDAGEGHINTMTVELGIGIGKLTGLLIEMEFKGLITPFPGGKYRPTKSLI